MFPLDFTAGKRILIKSLYELTPRRDFSMSIVLAAMALDCEMSYLFAKWRRIADGLRGDRRLEDEEIEKSLRKLGTIADRLNAICFLLSPLGIDGYVNYELDLNETLQKFPSLTTFAALAQGFQHTVFWPRNRILHYGYADYVRVDAERIYSIASFGIDILARLDKSKQSATLG